MIDFDNLVLGPCMAAFGEDDRPLYRPRGGGDPYLVDGVFDRAHTVVVMGENGVEVSTVSPVLGVRWSQIRNRAKPADMVSDHVDVPKAGRRYIISDAQPDGQGHVKLILNKAASL